MYKKIDNLDINIISLYMANYIYYDNAYKIINNDYHYGEKKLQSEFIKYKIFMIK
jgi:hypothetical protein